MSVEKLARYGFFSAQLITIGERASEKEVKVKTCGSEEEFLHGKEPEHEHKHLHSRNSMDRLMKHGT